MQSRLGRYVVLKHLASGGMADVLLGRTEGIEGFERHVVLKRIKPEHAKDSRFIRMFLDEARVAANLHHQHIVQVHDIGETAGEYFIAMEYLHGEDVRTILSTASKMRQHVPLGCAMAMVSAAAAGLHYAHERRGPDKRPLGIVHRDISPSNILVGYDGSIKVVDFGIAKASARQETRSSSLKGKISYMSPEQCKGAEVDRRSDVYSLGVVLYELATTTRLFKGESDYLVMDQIVNGRVTLPQVRRPELPNELSAIIMRAIAPDPERRYFTADELRVALDQFAAKASLTTSTSAIATYMRKVFGEKPEPWLELEGQDFDSFDEIGEPPATESAPGKSWTDLPPGEDFRRSTSSIPRQSGPIAVIAGSATSETARSSMSRLTGTPPPTDSKMGWESQQRAAAPRGFTPAKIAVICAPVIVLLLIAIWRLAGTGSSTSPVAATTAPPSQPAATAPVVTPLPEPPPPPAAEPAAPEPAAAAKPEPSPSARHTAPSSSSSSSSSSPSRRTSTAKVSETTSSPATVTKTESPSPAPPPSASAPLQSPAVTAAPAALPPAPSPSAPPSAPPSASSPAAVAATPSPPTTPPAERTVLATVLDANRTAGDKEIVPDESTQSEIARSGTDQINGAFRVCVTDDGSINTVSLLKSTGFPPYDFKIQSTIRKTWHYRPIIVSGKPTPVCTAVRFVYRQK
ncbi:MAG TPA: protein kinase [Kofleriaceae bacterium]|nr:protein kinase [Kofleriaceae bacterium]